MTGAYPPGPNLPGTHLPGTHMTNAHMTSSAGSTGSASPVPGDDHGLPSSRRRRSSRARNAAIAGVAAVVAIGVGAAAVVFVSDDEPDKAASQAQGPGATAPIVEGDMTVNADVDGTLGYGGAGSVQAQSRDSGNNPNGAPRNPGGQSPPPQDKNPSPNPSGAPNGPNPGTTPPTPKPKTPEQKEREKEEQETSGPQIFTALPRVGDTVKRGETMYEVNGRRVPLFYGDSPLWRALDRGVANGPDIRLVEQNLTALGFGAGVTVDDKFTDSTMTAIKRWQKSLGLPQTGRLDPSSVAVQPDAVRVTSVKASVGASAQGEVAAVSSTRRQVSVPMPVNKQSLARKGDKVSVRLPDGRTTTGTVAEIGTVAKKDDTGNPGMPGAPGKATVEVLVTLDKPEDAGALDGAPVTVGFTSESRKKVLSVPVNALVALAEGGYGVEIVDPATGDRRLVGVKPGLFANGRVEITGEGLAAGQKVRVPG